MDPLDSRASGGLKLDAEQHVVRGRCIDTFRGADGVLRILVTSSDPLELADGEALLSALGALSNSAPEVVLADIRALRVVASSVRRLMASPEAAQRFKAVALLVGNPVTRVIGSYFVRLNRPPFPTRLFEEEARALLWLRELGATRG